MESNIIDLIQYDETQPDIEDIMRQIRQHLAQKHGGRISVPIESSESRLFESEVYDELFEANQVFDKTFVTPHLTAVRIPFLGLLWQRLRSQFHSLTIFYVNRAADAQIKFNAQVVHVLNGIIQGLDRDKTPERIEALAHRVENLERRLQALEAPADALPSESLKGS